ncbi:MAG: 30S ribosomal protein S6 [Pseudomonadota bacterium]
MPLYEHVFLSRPDISGAQVESLVETFKGVIEEGGGSVGKVEYWGLKNLAYRINKSRKAHYSLLNIDAPHEAVAEMERQQRLHEDVMRIMTIKVEALDDEPSAMMQRRDRDDRRPRRDGDRPRRDDDRPRRDDDRPRRDDAAPAAANQEG